MEQDIQPEAAETENPPLTSADPELEPEAATPPFSPSSDAGSVLPQEASTYELDDEVRGEENANKGGNPFARVAEVIYDSYEAGEHEVANQHDPIPKPQDGGEHLTSLEPASSPQLHPRTHSMLHSYPAGKKNSNHSDNSNAKPFSVIPGEIPDKTCQKITKTVSEQDSAAATYDDILVHMTAGRTVRSLDRTAKLNLFRDAVRKVQNTPPKHDLTSDKKVQVVSKQRPLKSPGKTHFVDSATRIPNVVYGEVPSSEKEEEMPMPSPDTALPIPSLLPRTASMLGSDSADVGTLGQGTEVDSASAEDICDDIIIVHKMQKSNTPSKPKIAPKPAHLQHDTGTLVDSASAEDIYDDIIVFRMQKSNTPSKPKIAPKPAHLRQLLLRKQQPAGSLQSVVTDDEMEEEVYDDIIITAIQKQRLSNWSSFEDIYDDIVIKRLQKSKPNVPQRPVSVNLHPKVVEIRRLRKQKQLEAIEEIYDLDPVQSPELDEVYVDTAFMDSDDSGELPDIEDALANGPSERDAAAPVAKELELNSTPTADQESEKESETYQELVIYEELRENQDDAYQDIEKARIEALGLPDNIRNRACRIVKGPERKKLKKRIKSFRSLDRGNPDTSAEPAANNDGSPPTNESNTPGPERKLESKVEKVHPGDNLEEEEEEEEESHDGYMSHGKARQVLDMLLEANNVKKIPHMARSQSVCASSDVQLIPPDEDSDIEESTEVILPPEVKAYQEAGILCAKTKSDIAAEIKSLTDSAPTQPPPLPGVQRERSRAMNRDSLTLRQNVLKRTNTLPRMGSVPSNTTS